MPRLSKVTKELNVGLQTCVDFLQKKGHTVDNSLNAKISDEQYLLVIGGNNLLISHTPIPKSKITAPVFT